MDAQATAGNREDGSSPWIVVDKADAPKRFASAALTRSGGARLGAALA